MGLLPENFRIIHFSRNTGSSLIENQARLTSGTNTVTSKTPSPFNLHGAQEQQASPSTTAIKAARDISAVVIAVAVFAHCAPEAGKW